MKLAFWDVNMIRIDVIFICMPEVKKYAWSDMIYFAQACTQSFCMKTAAAIDVLKWFHKGLPPGGGSDLS